MERQKKETSSPNDILPVNGTRHASLMALPFRSIKTHSPTLLRQPISQRPSLNSIFHVMSSLLATEIFSPALSGFSIMGQFVLGKKWFSQNTGRVSAYLTGFSEDRFKDFRHSLA
ncbi:hypothetical protein CEXT_578671 [Caerostris extrusa]|uniref:Uncharacterized protein n=1 Tax=Caerostris extrusa TaxID=172846 RepID=A0AAV4WW30_CAEEX|nr:hypothetical protein CEXT_578671 [Caerostris extrusa]